jgi:S-methylmethionine-dependent homocysteine/selenocysteine methylase
LQALKQIRGAGWTGALGAYPDHGDWLRTGWDPRVWTSEGAMGGEVLAGHAEQWAQEAGCRMVGGCCGVGPETIGLLRASWAVGKQRALRTGEPAEGAVGQQQAA